MNGEVWRLESSSSSSHVSDHEPVPLDNRFLMNTIMLRFRPIAPKPVSNGSLSPVQLNQGKGSVHGKRPKRKYVRVRRNNEKLVESRDRVAPLSTLQLMPEKEESSVRNNLNLDLNITVEKIQILDNNNLKPPCVTANVGSCSTLDPPQAASAAVVAEWWVTVESVRGTCMNGGVETLGCTDAERVKNLETDTCPGFISDGYWKVEWLNDAFKRMIVSEKEKEKEESSSEMVVWLKVKDNSVWRCCYSYPSFSCSVRLQYTCLKEKKKKKCTKMVPCDVWRLESNGFAWRLDVNTALTLGL